MGGTVTLKLLVILLVGFLIGLGGVQPLRGEPQQEFTEEEMELLEQPPEEEMPEDDIDFIEDPEEVEEPEEIDPGDTETQFTFGYLAYHQDGNLVMAQERLERALLGDPGYDEARYWLGKTYYALGKNEKALETWEEGLTRPGGGRDRFQNALNSHQLNYDPPQPVPGEQWRLEGRISGRAAGRKQNLNPVALAPRENGGFFSASYKLGRIFLYSEEGEQLNRWRGFQRPTDLTVLDGRGVVVTEYAADRLTLIDLDGQPEIFIDTGLESPMRSFATGGSIYVYNDGGREIVRFSRRGQYIGTVWQAPPLFDVQDVALSPDGEFWVLDREEDRILILDRRGNEKQTHQLDPDHGVRRLFWREGELYAAGGPLFFKFDDDLNPVYLEADGESLPGGDVADILFSGDRLILSLFEGSLLPIYRPPEQPDPDLLFQERRINFLNYPVMRMNFIIRDPLMSSRFQHLGDKNFGIEIQERKALPSLLRPTRNQYGPSWVMVVDDAFESRTQWEEIQHFLLDVINGAPADSQGSIWSVHGFPRPTVQTRTRHRTLLRNAIARSHPYRQSISSDTVFEETLHRALDYGFRRRGSLGVILVTPRLVDYPETEELQRLANRLRNNAVPFVIVNPTVESIPDDFSLLEVGDAEQMNLAELSVSRTWSDYNQVLRGHYTGIFRSPIDIMRPGDWRRYALSLHYMNSIFRFSGRYLLP